MPLTEAERKAGTIVVLIDEDRMGNVTATPVRRSIRREFVRDARRNGAPKGFDGSLFMQQPTIDDVAAVLGPRAVLTTRRWRDDCNPCGQVNDGARIRVDAWTFRQAIGYAAG